MIYCDCRSRTAAAIAAIIEPESAAAAAVPAVLIVAFFFAGIRLFSLLNKQNRCGGIRCYYGRDGGTACLSLVSAHGMLLL